MKTNTLAAVSFAGAVVLLAALAGAAPKPSEVSLSWQLDIEFQDPQPVRVMLPGKEMPQTFWYMLYTVTNRNDTDQNFIPQFVLYTDTGQVLRAGRKIPTAVFDKIKQIHNDPLLKGMAGITGKLLQGADNAKSGVAIWSDIDPVAGAFDIFVGGLSGETVEVKLPKAVKVTEMGPDGKMHTVTKKSIRLAKTLQLRYKLPGEAVSRKFSTTKLAEKKWTMR